MRAFIQRVSSAKVHIANSIYSQIGAGLMVLVGIEEEDNELDRHWLIGKICKMRLFNDLDGIMNLSVQDIQGEIMLVSQFTLHASIKKGNRPSYIKSAKPEFSKPFYDEFVEEFKNKSQLNIQTGVFGADMKIELTNDGPVSIWVDTKNKE